MLFTGLGRSVYGLGRYSRPRAQFLPIRTSQPVNNIYVLCDCIIIDLRVSPWVHQAGVLHAISPISMKLGQFKGSTPKLKMTNWFIVWIFMVGDSPPNWFN